jgi:hypothetical protein
MLKSRKSLMKKKASPPIIAEGVAVERLMAELLKQQLCQSCNKPVGEEWGVVADVQGGEGEPAYVQAVRLCSACWSFPAAGMKKLGQAWL